MAKIGYIRVSTILKNTDRQEIALSEMGMDKVFIEKVSGKNTNRPELKKMLDYVREGDFLYIESISRLARSTQDLLLIMQQLQEKSVDLVSLKENIDTATPQGRFVLTIFAALAELDRENILQRQKEGIAAARMKGKKFGRPKIENPKDWDRVIALWENGQITAGEAVRKLALILTPPTVCVTTLWLTICSMLMSSNLRPMKVYFSDQIDAGCSIQVQ